MAIFSKFILVTLVFNRISTDKTSYFCCVRSLHFSSFVIFCFRVRECIYCDVHLMTVLLQRFTWTRKPLNYQITNCLSLVRQCERNFFSRLSVFEKDETIFFKFEFNPEEIQYICIRGNFAKQIRYKIWYSNVLKIIQK